MFVKFSGFNPKGSYLSLEKEKETFCVVFTYSIKRSREIRKFHVAVVQRRLRNEQKKRNARARAKLSPLSFQPRPQGFSLKKFKGKALGTRLRCRFLISALLLSSRNLATMVT